MFALTLLINLLVRRAANINLSGRLIILKSSLGTVAKGFYEVEIAKRPIFIISLADSSGGSVLSLAVLPQALKTALNLSLISFVWLLG